MPKINKILKTGVCFMEYKLFGKRTPIAISWAITNRCNSNCRYCNIKSLAQEELSTDEVRRIIRELKENNCFLISFIGGEPLMRGDIGEIIDYCKGCGMVVILSTNGRLLSERIEEVKRVDFIKLSLDGMEKTNDYLRGKGSFKAVMEAVEICKKYGINFKLNTVLSKKNLDEIDWILDFAQSTGAIVSFTPLDNRHSWGKDIASLICEREEYKKTIKKIIKKKREGMPISNSFSSLNHLMKWPEKDYVKCYAGSLLCRISADGKVYGCTYKEGREKGIELENKRFMDCFLAIKENGCQSCWCNNTLEFNKLCSFSNLDNSIKLLRKVYR